MSELASSQAFYELAKTGKYSKTWLTNKINQMQAHETQMAIWAWLREDEEAKFWLGMLLGSSAAVVGAMVSGSLEKALPGSEYKTVKNERDPSWPTWPAGTTMNPKEINDLTYELGKQGYPQEVMQGWRRRGSTWIYVPPGYVMNDHTGEVLTEEAAEEEARLKRQRMDFLGLGEITELMQGATSFVGLFKNIFSMAGLGFGAANFLILFNKSVFGDQGLNALQAEVL